MHVLVQCMRAEVLQLACQGASTALQSTSMQLTYLLVAPGEFPAAWAFPAALAPSSCGVTRSCGSSSSTTQQ